MKLKKNTLHKQVWSRFIRMPYGHFLDYADKTGFAPIPTSEECRCSYPNVLGWMTPIENGAFFGGLYLYALSEEYEVRPSDKLADEIKILVNGLLNLCDIGHYDGFIARGVAEDGISHYPFSSEDQAGPWLLGLWKLYNSPSCPQSLKDDIYPRMERTLRGIYTANYSIPTEWEGVTRGSYIHSDWRGSAKSLFCAYILPQFVSGNNELLNEYSRLRDEKPDVSIYTRAEIVSHGFAPDMVRTPSLTQFWIDICAHLCVYELAKVDNEYSKMYNLGLQSNAITASYFLDDYLNYENDPSKPFNMDWRILEEKNWSNADEAVAAGIEHCIEWQQKNKRRVQEHAVLGNMLFAAWISLTGKNDIAAQKAVSSLSKCIDRIKWEKVYHCYSFVAEAAIIDAEYKNTIKRALKE